jgi:hypothetical protein
MGLWLSVSNREKKKQVEHDREQEQFMFNSAKEFIEKRYQTLSANYLDVFRGRLATIFDDPACSPIDAASIEWKIANEHIEQTKGQITAEAQEALKGKFSIADKAGARERFDQHIDHLVSHSIQSAVNELMLMYVKELQSINDDNLPSITHGHPRKQFNLGNAHRLGENVELNYPKAERLLRLSANQGYTDAEALLGFMYFAGEGVTRDYDEALKWLWLAAEKDDAFGQNTLGILHTNGYGVTQNYEEALRWLHLSAAQGFAAAQTNIGTMYYEGEGVGQDKVIAGMWFILASAKGGTDALSTLIVARRSMSPEQINQSERLALANDKNVLQFLLRQSEGLLPDPLSIYHDPVLLAGYFTDGYLTTLMTSYKELARPTRSEIEQWSVTDFELGRCTEEIALLGAMGTVITVKNNKPADYYSTFIHALAGRVEKLLPRQDRVGVRDEIVKVIEGYIDDLDNERIVEFACTFTERVFSGNASESAIFAANFWDRAFAVGMGTMGASKEFFAACIAVEMMRSSSPEHTTS